MKEYLVTRGLFDRQRKLFLNEDYLEWEHGDLRGKVTRLDKSEIVDFKHGMDWIVWYKFTVGRSYSITFKTKHKEVRILFKSYFGLQKPYAQIYSDIVDHVWQFYYAAVVDVYPDRFFKGEEIEIQGLKLKAEGILLREKTALVPWEKVGVKDYYRYFAIFHKDDPNIHSRASFNEYGTECLWCSVRTILKDKERIDSQPTNETT